MFQGRNSKVSLKVAENQEIREEKNHSSKLDAAVQMYRPSPGETDATVLHIGSEPERHCKLHFQ